MLRYPEITPVGESGRHIRFVLVMETHTGERSSKRPGTIYREDVTVDRGRENDPEAMAYAMVAGWTRMLDRIRLGKETPCLKKLDGTSEPNVTSGEPSVRLIPGTVLTESDLTRIPNLSGILSFMPGA